MHLTQYLFHFQMRPKYWSQTRRGAKLPHKLNACLYCFQNLEMDDICYLITLMFGREQRAAFTASCLIQACLWIVPAFALRANFLMLPLFRTFHSRHDHSQLRFISDQWEAKKVLILPIRGLLCLLNFTITISSFEKGSVLISFVISSDLATEILEQQLLHLMLLD